MYTINYISSITLPLGWGGVQGQKEIAACAESRHNVIFVVAYLGWGVVGPWAGLAWAKLGLGGVGWGGVGRGGVVWGGWGGVGWGCGGLG